MLCDGEYGIIEKVEVEKLNEPETTYNFEVEDFHTYYVGEGVLVHNRGCNETAVIGKMKDLDAYELQEGEYKVADMLSDLGNPKSNWKQNSGTLRTIMGTGNPIKDVSIYPMSNAGFLGAERNLLLSRGWIYHNGFWLL